MNEEKYIEWQRVCYEIAKHDFGKPSKKYPRYVCMQKPDPEWPPNSVIERGAEAIRRYWNMKNLRKREVKI